MHIKTHRQGCHRLAPTAGASQRRGEVSSTSNQTSRHRKNEKDGCGQWKTVFFAQQLWYYNRRKI